MKQLQKRMLVQVVLGFFLGRVVLFGLNPVGPAYFAAGFTLGGAGMPVCIAVCLGMITALPAEVVIRYTVAMLALILGADLLTHFGMKVKMGHCGLLVAAVLTGLSAVEIYLTPSFQLNTILYAMFDVVLVLVFTRILYDGERFLLYSHGGQTLENEEMISLVIMGALVIYGLPTLVVAHISLLELVIYFVLAVVGYEYGAGVGAMAGAAGGVLLTLSRGSDESIGMFCLLGICAGMVRKQGKVWMLCAYLATAVGIAYALNGSMMSPGSLKALCIACGLLLVLPEKLIKKMRFPSNTGWKDPWTRENFQELIKHKLKDFSESFSSLSKTISSQEATYAGFSNRDMRKLMEKMSQQVCENCENQERCMGPVALSRPEATKTLAMAQEQGNLVLEQMPVEFTRECIHPERFLMQANQSLRLSRTILGFQNKLVQNRKILANQMKQVGQLVDELADSMEQIHPLPQDVEENIVKELCKLHVVVKKIVTYENKDGHLEIHMEASTVTGRLVTAREVSSVLLEMTGRPFVASQDSRNVIPRQDTVMVFEEDTPFHAITGVARQVKHGENVCGDNFSCLGLPGGELLLALSDGMGSGEQASRESQSIIELLEQMSQAGFSKLWAMQLINSMYLNKEQEKTFATCDVVVLNLFYGTCQFMKNGAAATYIKGEKNLEKIQGQSLPVGIVENLDPYLENCKLSSGDYVIMMTDGVADVFSDEEEYLEEILMTSGGSNPQEMAELILQEALRLCDQTAKDDMSVIVAGIWER